MIRFPSIGRTLNYGNPINWDSPLSRGLIARWQVLPAGGKAHRLTNLVRGGLPATFAGGPTWVGPRQRAGGFGAVSFDGSDDYLEVATTFVLPTAAGTVSMAWMPLSSYSGAAEHPLMRITTAGFGKLFDIVPYTDGNVYAGWLDGANDDRVLAAKPSVTLSTWNHWAITWINGGTTTLYFNGTSIGTSASLNATWDTSTAANFWLAADGVVTTNCLLDDIRIYSEVQSPPEIARDMIRGDSLNWRPSVTIFDTGAVAGNRRRRVLLGAAA